MSLRNKNVELTSFVVKAQSHYPDEYYILGFDVAFDSLTAAYAEVKKLLVRQGISPKDFKGNKKREGLCYIECTVFGEKAKELIETDF